MPKIKAFCDIQEYPITNNFVNKSPSTPTEKRKASKWKPFFFLLFFVFSVDSLDLLTDEVPVVLQLLDLAVHLVDEAVAFFRAGI